MILQKLRWVDDQGDERLFYFEDEAYANSIRGMILAQKNLKILEDEEVDRADG